ncbi:MAG: hypothetical protein U0166_23550 [Acidobacteriota bacterium]
MASAFKLLHVASLIMWLGPTTSAYLLVQRAMKDRARGHPLPRASELWVWRRFELLLRVEHVAFFVLFGSGLGIVHAWGLDPIAVLTGDPRWLRIKLWLAFGVILPVELYDIWLSHRELPRLLERLASSEEDLGMALRPHAGFLARGVWVFGVLMPAFFYLAVFKP